VRCQAGAHRRRPPANLNASTTWPAQSGEGEGDLGDFTDARQPSALAEPLIPRGRLSVVVNNVGICDGSPNALRTGQLRQSPAGTACQIDLICMPQVMSSTGRWRAGGSASDYLPGFAWFGLPVMVQHANGCAYAYSSAPSVSTSASAASRARSLSAIAAVLGGFSSELVALGVGHDGVMLGVLRGGGPKLLQPWRPRPVLGRGTQIVVLPVLGGLGLG
jgi:hypothetical protein